MLRWFEGGGTCQPPEAASSAVALWLLVRWPGPAPRACRRGVGVRDGPCCCAAQAAGKSDELLAPSSLLPRSSPPPAAARCLLQPAWGCFCTFAAGLTNAAAMVAPIRSLSPPPVAPSFGSALIPHVRNRLTSRSAGGPPLSLLWGLVPPCPMLASPLSWGSVPSTQPASGSCSWDETLFNYHCNCTSSAGFT